MSDFDQTNVDDLADAFGFLDDLRDGGTTNMYGAAPYLGRDLGISLHVARSVLSDWMRTFDKELSARERAITALGVAL